ncbi:MAG: ATP synthase F1 subunit gamma [Candidatus Kuenenbacteria bacterium]
MINTKSIKNRIQSVKNTGKITKAMEMVSAAKMRRATDNALGTRTYAELALELLVNISREQTIKHPLLEKRANKKILAIVIASNKGLCGGFNSNITKQAAEFIKSNSDKTIDFVTVGKKAENLVKKTGKKVIASFINFSDNLKIDEIRGLSKIVIQEFEKKNYDRVAIIFTDFLSSISYAAETRNLLPISQENIKQMIQNLGKQGEIEEKDIHIKNMSLYLFEPDEESILNQILPRLTEVQIYQALLESIASEHSARMMAMRNASDSAEEMINELTLAFNQARQAGITQEIAEISAGAAALN